MPSPGASFWAYLSPWTTQYPSWSSVEFLNIWNPIFRAVLGLHSLCFYSRGAPGVGSERSYWKLPTCPAEQLPGGSKDGGAGCRDPPTASPSCLRCSVMDFHLAQVQLRWFQGQQELFGHMLAPNVVPNGDWTTSSRCCWKPPQAWGHLHLPLWTPWGGIPWFL
uniref:Uncharacterized protein n=1 Tax=Geospiza parvula TaxID=87175 RepID=A0A8U8CG49_GEOPR